MNIVFKRLTLSIMLLIFSYSCSDFLDIKPKGSLSVHVLSTKQGIDGLLIGAYAMLDGTSNGFGDFTASLDWGVASSNWVYGSIVGGDAHKGAEDGDQQEINSIELYEALATNPYLNEKWEAVYEGVTRANEVLRVVNNVTDATTDDIARITAEARVLRGIFHFEAKRMWNMVPYISEHVDPSIVKNDLDIWRFIEDDLKFGYDSLPETMDAIGRINKWAAGAFYAKVLMGQGQSRYSEARVILQDIYDNGTNPLGVKYALVQFFGDNFNNAETENNPESVFALQYSVNDGSNGWNGGYGEILNFPHGGGPAGCCGFFQPSSDLVNSYRTDDNGWPLLDGSYNNNDKKVIDDEGFESDDPFEEDTGNLDPRLDWTVGRRNIPYLDWGNHPGKDWIRKQSYGGPYSPKKNVFKKSQLEIYTEKLSTQVWTGGLTANNYKVIRFADIILWLAECEVEVGSLDEARRYVNMIRERASNPAGFVMEADGVTPAAKYVINQYPLSGFPFDKKENALKAVRFERKLELAMEGHRFFDLVRWNEAAKTINSYLNYERTKRTYLNQADFDEGIDEYFPIPQRQIDLMGADILIQNR